MRGNHTSGRETTASARRQCSARERRPVHTGSSVSLDTLFSKNISPQPLRPTEGDPLTQREEHENIPHPQSDKGSQPWLRSGCEERSTPVASSAPPRDGQRHRWMPPKEKRSTPVASSAPPRDGQRHRWMPPKEMQTTRVSHPRNGAHELVTHSGAIQLIDTF